MSFTYLTFFFLFLLNISIEDLSISSNYWNESRNISSTPFRQAEILRRKRPIIQKKTTGEKYKSEIFIVLLYIIYKLALFKRILFILSFSVRKILKSLLCTWWNYVMIAVHRNRKMLVEKEVNRDFMIKTSIKSRFEI